MPKPTVHLRFTLALSQHAGLSADGSQQTPLADGLAKLDAGVAGGVGATQQLQAMAAWQQKLMEQQERLAAGMQAQADAQRRLEQTLQTICGKLDSVCGPAASSAVTPFPDIASAGARQPRLVPERDQKGGLESDDEHASPFEANDLA